MRDALSLTDQAIAFGSGRIDEVTVRQMLGSVDSTFVFQLIGALADGDGKAVVDVCESVRLHGLSAATTLEEMCTVLQRMAVLQVLGESASQITDPEFSEVAGLADRMPADETQLLYSMCLQGRAELGLAPDEYAALTMVLLRLLAFKPRAAQKKTLANPEVTANVRLPVGQRLPVRDSGNAAAAAADVDMDVGVATGMRVGRGDTAHIATPKAKVAAPLDAASSVVAVPVRVQTEGRAAVLLAHQPPAFVPTEEGDFWFCSVQQLVAQGAVSAMVRELALQSQLVARDTDQWVLRVERESLNQPVARERLTSALRSIGFEVALAVEVGRVTDCPARRISDASAERQLAAEKIIIEDPFVQGMMRDFGAKIVPGSIKPL
jgi:DNA polymerase-3 subunit gamma/tau